MAEGVVDFLEVIEVDEQEGQAALGAAPVVVFDEERIENLEEVTTVAETGQLVGDRLQPALLRQRPQASRRHRDADAHRDQRGDGKPEGPRAQMTQRSNKEHSKPRYGAETGQQYPPPSWCGG